MRILRTYARLYANVLDDALASIAAVSGEQATSRFTLPNGLELATVGRLLVIAGDERVLGPYRATAATVIVDDLDECRRALAAAGADVIRGPQQVPTGRNLTARLPGGAQLEYVEWDDPQWRLEGGRPT